jgi:NitT/TauT family transport system permease protein
MKEAATTPIELVDEPEFDTLPRSGLPRVVRNAVYFTLVIVAIVAAWEGYKLLWEATDGTVPLLGGEWPIRGDNRNMPHSWDIVGELFRPVRRGDDTILLVTLLQATLFTLREAALGFVIGGVVGFLIGVVFVRYALAERAFMPYVVGSQTIPILAIAPMVVIWGGQLSLPQWVSVSIIAAYLTFFPVAINTLRGLRSPEPTAAELMRSYAASKNEVLWKLQVPSAVPFIFTALKISATASVIGAIIGELPAGFPDGLGRSLLQFSQQFAAAPEKLYAAVLVAALAGIVFVGLVSLVERLTIPEVRRVLE